MSKQLKTFLLVAFIISLVILWFGTACSTVKKATPLPPPRNPSAKVMEPHIFHHVDNACASHGGVGLIKRVEYQCNDGIEGHAEHRD